MPIHMTKEQKMEKGREFLFQVKQASDARQDWINSVQLYRSLYYGEGAQFDKFWPNGNRIHFPILKEKIDDIGPRVCRAFWGLTPISQMERVGQEFLPQERIDTQMFMDWALRNDIPTMYSEFEVWVDNALLDGVSLLKLPWKEETRNTCEIHRLKKFFAVGETTPTGVLIQEDGVEKTPDDLVDEVFGFKNVEKFEKDGDNWKITFIEDRQRYEDKKVEIRETKYLDEVDVCVFRDITTVSRPDPEVVEPEDFFLPFRSKSVQRAQFLILRHWMTKEELLNHPDFQLSDKEKEVIESGEDYFQERSDEEYDELDKFMDEITGIIGTEDLAPFRSGKYEMFEVYISEDIDGDGQLEEVVYQVLARTGTAVYSEYLDVVFPHGFRPAIEMRYKPASDRFYSPGLGADLAPLNMQVNVSINQINEYQAFITRPFFFFEPTSLMTDPSVMNDIQPGQGIPANNPRDGVVFPQWTQTPLADMSLVTSVMQITDRISGTTPMAGGSTQYRNAPRTARGTLALISEGNIKIDQFIERCKKTSWKQLMQQVAALYSVFGPEEKEFYVLGKPRSKARIHTKLLRGNFEWFFDGDAANTNREAMQALAQQRYQLFASEPLYMQDQAARKELVDTTVDAMSQGANASALKPKLQGQGALHPPMDQETENMALMRGIWIDIHPMDNHAEHLADIDKLRKSAEFETLPEYAVKMLANHAKAHMTAFEQAFQQNNIPTGAGMGNNVPALPGGPAEDLGNIEGGVQ